MSSDPKRTVKYRRHLNLHQSNLYKTMDLVEIKKSIIYKEKIACFKYANRKLEMIANSTNLD